MTFAKGFLQSFIFVFMVSLLVVFVFLSWYQNDQAVKNAEIIKNQNQQLISKGYVNAQNWVNHMVQNTLFLASQQSLSEFSEEKRISYLQNQFSSFIRYHKELMQVRFIGNDGFEKVRVNREGDNIVVVPKNALQNKSHRDYFIESSKLNNQSIFISEFDLNIEFGRIEVPIKPTIRIASPVFDKQDNRIGLIVINFNGNYLLEQLTGINKFGNQKLWLVNQKGDWLIPPDGARSFGRLLGFEKDTVEKSFPGLAKRLFSDQKQDGTWEEAGYFMEVRQIDLLEDGDLLDENSVVNKSGHFELIASLPKPEPWYWHIFESDADIKLLMNLFVSQLLLSLLIAYIWSLKRYTDKKLMSQNYLIRSFFDYSPQAMFTFNEDGEVTSKNHQSIVFLKLVELVPENMPLDFWSTEGRKNIWQEVASKPKLDVDTTRQFSLELRGERRVYECQCFVIDRGYHFSPLIAVTIKDISSYKQLEAELQDQGSQLKAILDTAPDAIIMSDEEGRITLTNHRAQEIFKISEEQFLKTRIDDLVPSPSSSIHHSLREQFYKNPYSRMMSDGMVVHAKDSGGRIFDVEISLNKVVLHGVGYVLSIVRDVTNRVKLEQQLRQNQKMEAMGQLTGGIAHDFNNLLTTIQGNIELSTMLLEKSELNKSKVVNCLDTAMSASQKASRLTRRLLSFSRKEAKRLDVMHVSQYLQQELTLIQSALGKLIELHFFPNNDIWPIEVDPEEFMSSIVNLATNARDAMDKGGDVFIEMNNVSIVEQSESLSQKNIPVGDYVVLSFSDRGPGIAPEIIDSIFEPFFTTKSKNRGTGLGLAQVFAFTSQSKGHIRVYSELGVGTSFKFYFPKSSKDFSEVIKLQETSETQNSVPTPPAIESQGLELSKPSEVNHGRVLVVDDEVDVMSVAKAYLEYAGYEVVTADSGKMALEVLEKEHFDLIITDVIMPGMTGFELLEEVEKRFPDLPSIVCSGFSEELLKQYGEKEEGLKVLDKPYSRVQLIGLVEKILNSEENN
ncbi:hypothetical protein THMIRHAM_02700 [Thiomicrorhabdus immobilis]|uniref:histidine kinase n=1 Tax=Thiomicrorhabdus immobilis TaxID=2791037 RepID=A0ABM7MAW5_9GAMM|nr:response regulator [Thiomicrorhabdus immobilis]BCN92485.1 hypothetical protein THMIRHAM_02700 [Thiomicrorhabdus immobilis]